MKVEVIGSKPVPSEWVTMKSLVPGTVIRYGAKHLVVLLQEPTIKDSLVRCLALEDEANPRCWSYPGSTNISTSDIIGTVEKMILTLK